MKMLSFLILFPLLPAILLALIPQQKLRALIVWAGALVTAGASIWLATGAIGAPSMLFPLESHALDLAIFAGDMVITVYLLYRCKDVKGLEWYIPVLVVLQAAIIAYCELGTDLPKVENPLYVDNLSAIMALIIGIIGSLICVYAVSYMEDHHHHHPEQADGRRGFFFVMFLFLSGMFGVVFANNLAWMFFFWEVTTVCSFLLIGYTKTEEATRNAFHALGMNAIGGVGFALAILYQLKFSPARTIELDKLITLGPTLALVPAVLISFAGLTKSAQLPFSSWLLGAMVAPTPVSALLHSSTMVKAGVFAVLKFATVLQGTTAGMFIALVGGVTFLFASLLAVTQSNAKRVLAYSTVANLGLIVACAGIGTPTAIWAGILLVIFHAVSKGLLFLSVGTIEHQIGSRDIEDMDGLIVSRPALGLAMAIGIMGMFLAPFGMLISKWACLSAFIDASPLLAILLVYGSAPTLFFWSKWIGKLMSVPAGIRRETGIGGGNEWAALGILAVLTVLSCVLYPLISSRVVIPYILALPGLSGAQLNMSWPAIAFMLVMLVMMLALPLIFLWGPKTGTVVAPYLAGANMDGGAFKGSIAIRREVTTRNYYLSGFLSESALMRWGGIAAFILIVVALAAVKS
jgi:ech hydrogenase subunit A